MSVLFNYILKNTNKKQRMPRNNNKNKPKDVVLSHYTPIKRKGVYKKGNSWMASYPKNGKQKRRSFKTKEEAKAWRKKHQTKNQIISLGDDMFQIELTQGKIGTFSRRDLKLVKKYTLCALQKKDGYWCVKTHVIVGDKRKYVTFANVILNHIPTKRETVDHINNDPLDNRIENLRITSLRIQQINRRTPKHNKSGIKGISRIITKGYVFWVAYCHNGQKRQQKAFSINKYGEEGAKTLAVACRKEMEATSKDYQVAFCLGKQ